MKPPPRTSDAQEEGRKDQSVAECQIKTKEKPGQHTTLQPIAAPTLHSPLFTPYPTADSTLYTSTAFNSLRATLNNPHSTLASLHSLHGTPHTLPPKRIPVGITLGNPDPKVLPHENVHKNHVSQYSIDARVRRIARKATKRPAQLSEHSSNPRPSRQETGKHKQCRNMAFRC